MNTMAVPATDAPVGALPTTTKKASRLRVYDAASARRLRDTSERAEIAQTLDAAGVRFERWDASVALGSDADQASILAAYERDIARLRAEGGYTTADVLRVTPATPDRAALREKFRNEHSHTEDEVRFFVEGDAAFYLHVADKVYQTICVAGDLIGVPAGATHWFDMGPEARFTAIRLFQSTQGWTPDFTGDDIATRFPAYE